MQQLLKTGQIVKSVTSGQNIKIESYLGGGGQGEVYKVDFNGGKKALKWYYQGSATDVQRKILDTLIKNNAPNAKFLWPQELVESPDNSGFGYIMTLRESKYKSIIDLMKRRIDPSFEHLITACYHLADSFFQLHSKGYSYRDISFGNVFFDPASGDVLICDNDNVAYDNQTKAGILGTPSFMAPEIVRGEAFPSVNTDRYSLAVLLFYMLMISHPLDGKKESSIRCLDLPARNKLYGTEPLFIYDPDDDSNRPVRGYHDNAIEYWGIYPQSVRDLFTKAFTEGIKDPMHGRVVESQWKQVMIGLRDSLIYCGNCGAENFYDQVLLKNGQTHNCWSCKKTVQLPFRIKIDKSVIMLNSGKQLYPHHIKSDYDFSQPIAQMTQHPSNPNLWGLKNVSSVNWILTKADGTKAEVEPGKSASIAVGNKINFGPKEGEISF